MEYVCPINISKYKEIQDKFKDKELIATNKRNITLSREEQDWLSTQILSDVDRFDNIKHRISKAIIFVQPPQLKGIIHVDGIHASRVGHPNWALNIPITNSDAEMYWYQGNYSLKAEHSKGLPYLDIEWTYGPNIAKTIKINHPMIVNIDTPHSVTNFSNHTRMILSVRFSPDLNIQ